MVFRAIQTNVTLQVTSMYHFDYTLSVCAQIQMRHVCGLPICILSTTIHCEKDGSYLGLCKNKIHQTPQ